MALELKYAEVIAELGMERWPRLVCEAALRTNNTEVLECLRSYLIACRLDLEETHAVSSHGKMTAYDVLYSCLSDYDQEQMHPKPKKPKK